MDLKLTLVPHAQRPLGIKRCNMTVGDGGDGGDDDDGAEIEILHVCMAQMSLLANLRSKYDSIDSWTA